MSTQPITTSSMTLALAEMTQQARALSHLIHEGAGVVGPETYRQILGFFNVREPSRLNTFCGLKLIMDPMVPEGKIWPLESYKPQLPRAEIIPINDPSGAFGPQRIW